MHCNQGFKIVYKFAVILYVCTSPKCQYVIFIILLFGKGVFPPSFVIHQYVIFSFNGRHTLVYSNTWYWL